MQLKIKFNDFLTELGLKNGKIRSINKLRNDGTLIEMDSDNATLWMTDQENRNQLCTKIGPGVLFRTRVHNLIAFNVPLDISPEDPIHRQEVCEVNSLDPNTITAMKWIKPVHRRSQTQRTAHLNITFNNADAANRVITNGIYICNRRCHAERVKREPMRCLKCQGWNHFAKDCIEENDKCGNCTKNHRTNDCPTPLITCCVSCKTEGHASWSRECPTFIKKQNDLNERNPENLLQYIPTADPWTWTASITQTQTQPPSGPVVNRERAQASKKNQLPPRRVDTYIPDYDSYIPSYDRKGRRQEDRRNDPHPPPPADLTQYRPMNQQYVDSVNKEHSNRPANTAPAPTPTN
jgi:hypothetical protein